MRLLAALSTVAGILLIGPSPTLGQTVMLFEDDFGGSALDPAKWRTDILTTGVRWCDPNAGWSAGPGRWIDPATESCYGAGQAPPFGSTSVANGLADFSATAPNRGFPYTWTGPPTPGSPFPTSGDFTLRVRMRFNRIAVCGAGITVVQHPSPVPTSDNAPTSLSTVVVQIWADGLGLRVFGLRDGTYYEIPGTIPNPLDVHEYTITYQSGEYRYFVDGAQIHGPISSSVRPTTIAIGNPVFTYWMGCDWTAFSVDYIGVAIDGATPVAPASWGTVKSIYRY